MKLATSMRLEDIKIVKIGENGFEVIKKIFKNN